MLQRNTHIKKLLSLSCDGTAPSCGHFVSLQVTLDTWLKQLYIPVKSSAKCLWADLIEAQRKPAELMWLWWRKCCIPTCCTSWKSFIFPPGNKMVSSEGSHSQSSSHTVTHLPAKHRGWHFLTMYSGFYTFTLAKFDCFPPSNISCLKIQEVQICMIPDAVSDWKSSRKKISPIC